MHTQEAVVVLAAGGVIATITVQSVTDSHALDAIGLMEKLVQAAVIGGANYRDAKGQAVEPVVGMAS